MKVAPGANRHAVILPAPSQGGARVGLSVDVKPVTLHLQNEGDNPYQSGSYTAAHFLIATFALFVVCGDAGLVR